MNSGTSTQKQVREDQRPTRSGGPSGPRAQLLRRLCVAAAVVLLLVVVAAIVVALTVDWGRLTAPLLAAVEQRTGRELAIRNGPRVAMSLTPTLVAEGVTFGNPPWASRPEMVRAERVEATIALLPLLHGVVTLRRVELEGLDLRLETAADGTDNWTFERRQGETRDEASGAMRLDVGSIRLRDATLGYRDGQSGQVSELAVEHLELAAGGSRGDRVELQARLGFRGTPIEVGGGATTRVGLGLPAAAVPLEVTASLPGATVTAVGTAGRNTGAELEVSLEITDPAELERLLDASLPAARPLFAQGRLSMHGADWAVRELAVTLGTSQIHGSIDVVLRDGRPEIDATLSSPRIDLAQMLTRAAEQDASATGGEGETRPARKLFAATPIGLDPLFGIDVSVRLDVDAVLLPGGYEVGQVAAEASVRDATLTLDPITLQAAGGTVSARLTLTKGPPWRASARVRGRELTLQSILSAAGIETGIVGGPTEVDLDVSGSGLSLHDVMADLRGSLLVVVGSGQLEAGALALGGDILTTVLEKLNPFEQGDTTTELLCAVINVPLAEGVAKLDHRVAIETSQVTVVARGTVDLGEEQLAVDFHSRAAKGLGVGLASLSGFVGLRGPLSQPRLGLTPTGTARTAASLGAAIATVGLTLVGERLLDELLDASPCQRALKPR